jgi:hypothetical protein
MTNKFKDLFISYGRCESLSFVGRLPNNSDYTQRVHKPNFYKLRLTVVSGMERSGFPETNKS